MRFSEIDFQPSDRTVRQFAGCWLLFFGGMAIWQGTADRPVPAIVLAVVAKCGSMVGLVRPAWLRPVYEAWMVAAFPVGWLVSHVLLGLLFLGLVTPLALFFKLTGRDPLQRRQRPKGESYWISQPAPSDVGRYFRPY